MTKSIGSIGFQQDSANAPRLDRAIGRVGALAVMLGVGLGLGVALGCGVASAAGPDSTASSSTESSHTSTAHSTDRASTHLGKHVPVQRPDDAAGPSSAGTPVGTEPTHTRTVGTRRISDIHSADIDSVELHAGGSDSAPTTVANMRTGLPAATSAGVDTAAAVPSKTAAVAGQPVLSAAASATPITVMSIVTDTLTWMGLGGLAPQDPGPLDLPVSSSVALFWQGVRESQSAVTTPVSSRSFATYQSNVGAIGPVYLNGAMITGTAKRLPGSGRIPNWQTYDSFTSSGITVGAIPRTTNWETVRVQYFLQSKTGANLNTPWTTISSSSVASAKVRATGYVNFGSWNIPSAIPATSWRMYRVIYAVEWRDATTGQLLASTVIVPATTNDNTCATGECMTYGGTGIQM